MVNNGEDAATVQTLHKVIQNIQMDQVEVEPMYEVNKSLLPESMDNIILEIPVQNSNVKTDNDIIKKCTIITSLMNWKPNTQIFWIIIYILLPILCWVITFLLVETPALPGGPIFSLIVLEFVGIGLGVLINAIKLPPLLGMLAVGILIRNVSFIDFGKNLSSSISSPLRQIALVIILIRAGLGLDAKALMRLKGVVLCLAFFPCTFEAITIGITTHFILGFPWSWGFLLGFVLAAVSPAVVVPCLLNLKENGYGVDKGIPTIVIAAASIDDILAISMFGVTLGFALSQGTITESLIQGPVEFLFGITFGICWGLFIGLIPIRNEKMSREETLARSFLLLCGGIISVFGFQYIEYLGAGALGCLLSAFVAAIFWRKENLLNDNDDLSWTFSILWLIFQPLLFGLIGCEMNISSIDGKIVGLGIICLVIGLMVRLFVSVLATSNGSLSLKEKIFVAIAWLPKATVQAAIGPVALDTARKLGSGQEAEELGLKVLTIAILSILLTAPIGAIAIMFTGPKLLNKNCQIK